MTSLRSRGGRSVAVVQFLAQAHQGRQDSVAGEHGRNKCEIVSIDACRQSGLSCKIRKAWAKIIDDQCNTRTDEGDPKLGVLCVCDNAKVQRALLQILLVRKQFSPQVMLANLLEAVQPPITVWVVENSWMMTDMMIRL